MDRLENKIERLSNENTLLKQEVQSLKTDADFQHKWFGEAKRDFEKMKVKDPIEEDIILIQQKHQQLEDFLGLKIDLGEITYGLVGLLRRLEMLKGGKKVKV